MAEFTFRELDAWKQGMALVEEIYRGTRMFPQSEQYGITSQIRRAALSIPCNVAEGHCRRSTRAFMNHVSIALGSLGELDTLVDVCHRLDYFQADEQQRLSGLAALVGRLLNGLYNSLERKLSAGRENVKRVARVQPRPTVSRVGVPTSDP